MKAKKKQKKPIKRPIKRVTKRKAKSRIVTVKLSQKDCKALHSVFSGKFDCPGTITFNI